jgi:hypothetical protein
MNRNIRRRTKQELIHHVRFRTVTTTSRYSFRQATDLLSGKSYGFYGTGALEMEKSMKYAATRLRSGDFQEQPIQDVLRVRY